MTALAAALMLLYSGVQATSGFKPKLEVRCDEGVIRVRSTFSEPFSGAIYSRSSPDCRFFDGRRDAPSTSVNFEVPFSKCGTTKGSDGFENVVVFQHDSDIEAEWDMARRVACMRSSTFGTRVAFQPFVVEMSPVLKTAHLDGEVETWMAIERGRFPASRPVHGRVKVGEDLSILIFLRDRHNSLDVRVKSCHAYDGPEATAAMTLLTTADGCPAKPKIIEAWRRTYHTGPTNASLIAFTTLKSFKFPQKEEVYIECEIDICIDRCDSRCPIEPAEPDVVMFPKKPPCHAPKLPCTALIPCNVPYPCIFVPPCSMTPPPCVRTPPTPRPGRTTTPPPSEGTTTPRPESTTTPPPSEGTTTPRPGSTSDSWNNISPRDHPFHKFHFERRKRIRIGRSLH